MDIYEKLAQQWDTKRNLFPFSVPLPHGKPYWWICDVDHSWEATITNRKQFGCPICAGKKIVAGINDLASNYPELAKEWHPTKNSEAPEAVSKKSSKPAWWLGKCGHEWQAKPLHRATGSGCPFCSKSKVLPGFNDVVTTHPELIKEWHPTKNKELDASSLTSGSNKLVWWLGECGHEWEARISNRTQSKTGCHECSSFKKSLRNSNTAIEYPHLLDQWSSKNPSSLDQYVSNSSHVGIWFCDEGHEWEQPIKARVRSANRCVVCTGHQLMVGMNDFKSRQPELSKEWHPTKNTLSPDEVTFSSGRKVWWLGKCGHEWEAQISNRTNGAGCYTCGQAESARKRRLPKKNNSLAEKYPQFAAEWNFDKNNNIVPELVNSGSRFKAWWICDKGHEWQVAVSDRTTYKTNCPRCAATTFSSRGEKMIYDFVKGLFPDAEANVRSVLDNNQELDIWVPGKNFAVEFNGLYWHDEHHKPRNYHYDKWLECKKKGIQLVQVWEDDWESRPDIVKAMLSHKLGVSSRGKVYARNTEVVDISQVRMNEFLGKYHIQGANDGSVRVALVRKEKDFVVSSSSGLLWDEPELLAVMLLKREPGAENTLNLLRFATAEQVVGGFTKLLKHVEEQYNPDKIITFSDNTVSDGGLYENNGFVAEFQLKPDYMYVANGKRIHKFNYRLKRFRDDPELLWDESLTERELALLNNLPRIWDAGKTRWVKTFKQV